MALICFRHRDLIDYVCEILYIRHQNRAIEKYRYHTEKPTVGCSKGVGAVKRLYRSRDERMIWGVCGGIAKYFDMDPTIIRLIAVLTLFIGFAGVLVYIILAIIVPLEPA